MAGRNSIAPFPADIDRDAFANWLSGFTDGEGCFLLRYYSEPGYARNRNVNGHQIIRCNAQFRISLRADDEPALRLIQSFWQCGRIFNKYKRAKPTDRRKPGRVLVLSKVSEFEVAVDHFCRYPLYAKKARDFDIWKEGVLLLKSVSSRSRRPTSIDLQASKWTTAERMRYADLAAKLQQCRLYDSAAVTLTALPPLPAHPTLFD